MIAVYKIKDWRRGENFDAATDQRGTTAIMFMAFILPFLFFLLTLSLDVSRYFADRRAGQAAADEAVLYGRKFLPNTKAAKEAVRLLLSQRGELESNSETVNRLTTIEADSDFVSVHQSYELRGVFAEILGKLTNLKAADSAIHSDYFTRARGMPLDVFIALDRSAYLAPAAGANSWGTSSDWPAANYFTQVRSFMDNGQIVNPRWVTQQCFNPRFLALKQIAIQLYEYFNATQLNSTGLGAFPGNGADLDLISPQQLASLKQRQGHLPGYQARFGSDGYCAAAADYERNQQNYRFRDVDPANPGRLTIAAGSRALPDLNNQQIASTYSMFARDAIWSLLAHDNTPSFNGVLSGALGQVIPRNWSARGSLANASSQTIIFVADDVPWVGVAGQSYRLTDQAVSASKVIHAAFEPYRQLVQSNPGYRLKIFYLIPALNNLSGSGWSELNELENLFAEEQKIAGAEQDNFKISLIKIESAADLNQVISAIALDRQTSVVAK